MIEYNSDETTSKLTILYVLDKMECELTEESLIDICYYRNKWTTYFTCTIALSELVKSNYVNEIKSGQNCYYQISPDGRSCLSYFFTEIPLSIREQIGEYVEENKLRYKRKQEYFSDCFKNSDNSYTVLLKIVEPTSTKLELKMLVDDIETANEMQKQWQENASKVYASIIDTLI